MSERLKGVISTHGGFPAEVVVTARATTVTAGTL
jgi:hypothetical protein